MPNHTRAKHSIPYPSQRRWMKCLFLISGYRFYSLCNLTEPHTIIPNPTPTLRAKPATLRLYQTLPQLTEAYRALPPYTASISLMVMPYLTRPRPTSPHATQSHHTKSNPFLQRFYLTLSHLTGYCLTSTYRSSPATLTVVPYQTEPQPTRPHLTKLHPNKPRRTHHNDGSKLCLSNTVFTSSIVKYSPKRSVIHPPLRSL
jgi:hypothetical protein